MQNFYGNAALELPCRAVLRNTQGARKGGAITVDSTVVDTGNGLARTTLIRQGLVVVKVTSTGRFIRADTSGGDRNAVATKSSLVAIGAGAASKTFKWRYKGGAEQSVTTGAGDNTAALVAAALNADAGFARHLIASNSGSTLIVSSREAGSSVYFEITDGTINGQGGTAQDTFANNTTAGGTDADYRVLGDDGGLPGDMFDPAGAVANQTFANWIAGDFDSSKLIGPTAESLAVLAHRGSTIL